MTQVVRAQAPNARMTWRPVRAIFWTEFFWVSTFVIGVFLPYYANDLDSVSLSELGSGAHDPKDLWPRDTALVGFVGLGGLLTMMIGPMVALGVLGWVPFQLVDRRRDLGARGAVVLLLAAAVSAATLAWLASPLGGALMRWWLD